MVANPTRVPYSHGVCAQHSAVGIVCDAFLIIAVLWQSFCRLACMYVTLPSLPFLFMFLVALYIVMDTIFSITIIIITAIIVAITITITIFRVLVINTNKNTSAFTIPFPPLQSLSPLNNHPPPPTLITFTIDNPLKPRARDRRLSLGSERSNKVASCTASPPASMAHEIFAVEK